MEQGNQQITDYGFDPLRGADILTAANISILELHDPAKLAQIQEIVSFFSGYEDGTYRIKSMLAGKNVEPTKFLSEYVGLRKQYGAKMAEISKLADEIKLYE